MNEWRQRRCREIVQAAAAGQIDSILSLGAEKPSKKRLKKLKKRLKASENWTVSSDTIRNCSGTSISAYAEWCGIVAVNLKGTVHRFRILALYYCEEIRCFALPVRMMKSAESIKELPGIEFSPAEIRLLFDMAEELRNTKSDLETTISLKHPLRGTIFFNINRFREYNETLPERLLRILRANVVVLQMMLAAFDAQLRVIKTMKRAPFTIYNFTPSSKDLQASERIVAIFTALNFTVNSGASEPLIIRLKDDNDLHGWYSRVDRLTILRATGTSLLQPLVKDIIGRDQNWKAGGLMPAPLPTVPIVLSKGLIHDPVALDVSITQGEADLSAEDKSILRHAMAQALNTADSDCMLEQLEKRLYSKKGYHLNPRVVWWEILAKHFFQGISTKEEFQSAAAVLMDDNEEAMEEARNERNESIQRAVDLLKDPGRYKKQIIDRPISKDAAREALSGDAVAFRFIPSRGDDAGKKFLAFTKESLLRLLKQISVGEEYYDAFLNECEKNGILDMRKRTVKFGDETYAVITFQIDF